MNKLRLLFFAIVIAGVWGGAIFATLLRFGIDHELPSNYLWLITLATVIASFLFKYSDLYNPDHVIRLPKRYYQIFISWAITLVLLIIIGFLFKANIYYSRLWIAYWFVISLAIFYLFDAITEFLQRYLRTKGAFKSNIVILGAGDAGKNVLFSLMSGDYTEFNIVAFFDDNRATHNTCIENVPVIGDLDCISDYLANNDIHEVWIALPSSAVERVKDILAKIRHTSVTIRYVPDFFSLNLLGHEMSEFAGIPSVNLSQTPMRGLNRMIKDIEDKLLAFIFLIISLPFCIVIAISILATSKGPVLYKQIRLGWDGRPIKIYKFRTMYLHDEGDKTLTQATRNDHRVTKVGKFLRATSLDELPQFLNVLQGRMSIVGPRPHAVQHNEYYKDKIDKYMFRHRVKPGITGWAQINGYRGETDTLEKMEKRVECDLYYIDNWSLWFDLKIIVMTIFKGFVHKNAY